MTPPRSCFVAEVRTPLPPGDSPSANTPVKFALCAMTPPATKPPAACGVAIDTTGVVSGVPASPPSPMPVPEPPLPLELPPLELEVPAELLLEPAEPALLDEPPFEPELELELPQAKRQAAPSSAKP